MPLHLKIFLFDAPFNKYQSCRYGTIARTNDEYMYNVNAYCQGHTAKKARGGGGALPGKQCTDA